MKLSITLGLIAILLSVSCTNDDESAVIETELVAYFDLFVEEAEKRGVDIDLESLSISGYVENIEERGTLGQCKSYSNGAKSVVVDEPYWNTVDDLGKEYIVFHELGHCILGRDHNSDKAENGHCLSIMQSGDDGCRGVYTDENRKLLLDELFD